MHCIESEAVVSWRPVSSTQATSPRHEQRLPTARRRQDFHLERQADRARTIPSSRSSAATAPARTSGRPACACSTPRCRRPTAASGRSPGSRCSPAKPAKNKFDNWLPDDTVEAFKEYLVGIKGPLTTPVGGGIRSLNVALRQMLDLYVCLRPVQYFTGVPSPVKHPEKVNMVIFRENTEDIYAGIDFEAGGEAAQKMLEFLQEGISRRSSRRSASAMTPSNPIGVGIKPVSQARHRAPRPRRHRSTPSTKSARASRLSTRATS